MPWSGWNMLAQPASAPAKSWVCRGARSMECRATSERKFKVFSKLPRNGAILSGQWLRYENSYFKWTCPVIPGTGTLNGREAKLRFSSRSPKSVSLSNINITLQFSFPKKWTTKKLGFTCLLSIYLLMEEITAIRDLVLSYFIWDNL